MPHSVYILPKHPHITKPTNTHTHTLQNKLQPQYKLKETQYKLEQTQYKLEQTQYKLKQTQYKVYPNEIVNLLKEV